MSGNKVLVCGNGGSAADGADFCTEFACRFVEDRRPYPAMNLSQGGSLLTATGNDYGFEEIDRKSTRLNSSNSQISYAVFCLKKKKRYMNACDAFKHGICRPNIRRRITIPLTLSSLKLLRRIPKTEHTLPRMLTLLPFAIEPR